MNNSIDKHSKLFQKLFQSTLEEKPSLSFTETLMERIEASKQEAPEIQKPAIFSMLSWIAIISSFFIIGSGVLYYFQIQFLPSPNFEIITPVVKGLQSSFSHMFNSFRVSPLTIAILSGIISLVIIDRILRAQNPKKHSSSYIF